MGRKRIIFVLFIIGMMLSACAAETAVDVASVIGTNKMVTISPVKISFPFDYTDLNALVSYQPYVFVGRVEEYVETVNYENNYAAMTVYSVTVVENIKGELITNEPVLLRKAGGNITGTDKFIVMDGDTLPQVGKLYIFFAGALDGIPYCGIPGTNRPVTEEYTQSDIYKEVVDACKEMVVLDVTPRETVSIYDVNYNK